jgi:hypothetical protein
MKTVPVLLYGGGLLLASIGCVVAADPAPPTSPAAGVPESETGTSGINPTSKRDRLALDGTAITEFTEEGRKFSAPTAAKPAYFLTHSGGQHDFGQVSAGQKLLSDGIIERQLAETLTASHYLPATGGHQPSLVLIYIWGTHSRPEPLIEDPGYKNVLSRAALIGGRKFASELKEALIKDENSEAAIPAQAWGAQMLGGNSTGAANLFTSFSPLETFRRRDAKTARLLERIGDECYYVVVSAYDYAAMARGENRLLWHTKLSACSRGLSLAETVPALLIGGASAFGRDMSEPEFLPNRRR